MATNDSRAPFEVIPFTGCWKVLDWKRGRYICAYDSFTSARRYASSRNRKAGFFASAVVRNATEAQPPYPPLQTEDEFEAELDRYRRLLSGGTDAAR